MSRLIMCVRWCGGFWGRRLRSVCCYVVNHRSFCRSLTSSFADDTVPTPLRLERAMLNVRVAENASVMQSGAFYYCMRV